MLTHPYFAAAPAPTKRSFNFAITGAICVSASRPRFDGSVNTLGFA